MMQQSGPSSPREDDQQARGTSDEDQPVEGATVAGHDRRGTPEGMTAADVEARSDVARFLGTSAFPGTREELLAKARENQAPDDVLRRIASAAPGPFQNLQELVASAGIGTEGERT